MTERRQQSTHRSGERGMALVIVMFLTLVLSVLASSLAFVARTETLSSYSFKTMAQARYAAESGLHSAANHLLWTYQAPGTVGAAVADPIASYVTTGATVKSANQTVVLSSNAAFAANYPVASVRNAFSLATQGTMAVNPGQATYTARATLLSMRQFVDASHGGLVTVQTWEVTGTGRAGADGAAEVEVSAIIERNDGPLFKYAAFATGAVCTSLRFAGGANVNSYDSRLQVGVPVLNLLSGGNVATNGNMNSAAAATSIKGTLSTPKVGTGACAAGGPNALTTAGGGTITGGIVTLPQAVSFPAPPALSPMPPVTTVTFNLGCPAGTAAFCSAVGAIPTINPALTGGIVTLGNLRVQGATDLHLKAGTYVINSLVFVTGPGKITVDSPGKVIIKVAGAPAIAIPINFANGTIINTSYDASTLEFIYGGALAVTLTTGVSSAAIVYAPGAAVTVTGTSEFYGAVVARAFIALTASKIHYDRKLQTEALTVGKETMGSYSWRTF